jgi:hypothetical protein
MFSAFQTFAGSGAPGSAPPVTPSYTLWDASPTPDGTGSDFASITLGGQFLAVGGSIRVIGFKFYWDGLNNGTGFGAAGWGFWDNLGGVYELHPGLSFPGTSGWITVNVDTPRTFVDTNAFVMAYYAPYVSGGQGSFGHMNAVNPHTVDRLQCLRSVFIETPGLNFPSSNFNSQDYCTSPVVQNVG